MPSGRVLDKVIATALLSTMAMVVVARFFGDDSLWYVAWTGVGLSAIVTIPRLRAREFYLLSLTFLSSFLVWNSRADWREILAGALDQAGFLVAFILLLTLLREAAVTSPSISEIGAWMTRQRPGRRYAALFSGTAAMAVIFNVGVVSFLVPLIQRGIVRADPGDGLNHLRERRQISAMLRGFAWSVVWSPTAIAPLALFELIPGVNRLVWIGWGFVAFLIILVIGWAEDRWRFRKNRPSGLVVPFPLPRLATINFLLACTWLLGLSWIISKFTGDTVVFGLMVSCPIMLIGWLTAQNGISAEGRAATFDRLREISTENLAPNGPLAVTLACSGFLGRAGAGLVPGDDLVTALGVDSMPVWILLGALPIVLSLFSLLGFSPIMMAIFFGSFFGGLSVLPADPTIIALSISCGWALSMTFSPFATVNLLIQRISGIPASRLTFGWNLLFTVLAAFALVIFFALLDPIF